MTKSTLYPQFFHTLVPEFRTHITIPVDFFSKYIQESVGKETAKLKSDKSDITWQVKMTGLRLSDGWEEFAVAHNLQIGNVVLVRYEGDMVFHVSDLGPNSCEIPAPSGNDLCDQNSIDNTFLKNNLHPRTHVYDGDGSDSKDNIEFHRNKKAKKNNPGTEADISSFVALVTALNLRTDTLHLPQHFTSSNGLARKCGEIVLTDERERSWTLNLRFNKPSDTFYISPGWRNFCDENGENVGGFFMFRLVANGETPVLSFSPRESINGITQREFSEARSRKSLSTEHNSEEENTEEESSEDDYRESLMEIEKKKYSLRRIHSSYSSYSPMHTRFVTFTLPPDYVRIGRLSLPAQFIRENGINKPGEIFLLGKNGTKQLVNLALDKKGTMSLGKGWKDFVKANGLEKGFMLKLIWEDTTPVLSLCCADSSSDRGKKEFSEPIEKQSLSTDPSNRDEISKDENNKESSALEMEKKHLRWKDSTSPNQNRFVTLTLTHRGFERGRMCLPKQFMRENSMNMNESSGMITLLGKDGTKWVASFGVDNKGTMTLRKGWKEFAEANGLKVGQSFTLELIWEDITPMLRLFCTESSCDRKQQDECPNGSEKESASTKARRRDSSSAIQKQFVSLRLTPEVCTKESLPVGPSSREKIIKDDNSEDEKNIDKNNKEESSSGEREKNHLRWRNSTSPHQNRFVTLTLSHSGFKRSKMCLPKQFVRENSMNMNEPGMITLLGKEGTKWVANLGVDKQGTMSLRKGWKEFAEANGLKVGQSFTLELIWEDTTPMLRLLCTKSSCDRKQQDECPNGSEKESISTEARRRDSSSAIQNQFVTLRLTPEDVRACKLHLPSQFMRANGINKLGKITLLGKDGLEEMAYLLTKDGCVALGCGWKDFCEANGVKTGETFTLEFVNEKDTNLVLKFCSSQYINVK